jgi:hypothetical protein
VSRLWKTVENIAVGLFVLAAMAVLMPVVWAALAVFLLGLALVGAVRWLVRRTPLPRWRWRLQVRRADRKCRASGLCAVCRLAAEQPAGRRPR